MALGATILISIHYPAWHQGKVRINTAFKAFSTEKVEAILGVKIGLKHINITLKNSDYNDLSLFIFRDEMLNRLDYNERVMFMDMYSMERELERALRKGLPYPILKVIEYLSVDRAGFVWGRQYRLAGYYTCAALWFAFGCWLVMVVVLCLLPQYYPILMLTCGVSTLMADLTYAYNTPDHLTIRFPGPQNTMSILEFSFSYCFYATAAIGLLSAIYGCLLWLIQEKTAYAFDTFLSSYLDEACRAKPQKKRVSPRPIIIPRPIAQTVEMETTMDMKTPNGSPITVDEQISSSSDF
uniref:Uncharacterized protein n=1 Tax=Acrobeloides nanus TaxID=290746 RepID=A0A914BXP5_9BILA